MGKEGDLWDDSALIDAFDHAISNYKTLHGRGQNDSSKAGGKVVCSIEESLSTSIDGSHEARRSAQADDNGNVASSTTTELGEPSNHPEDQKNQGVDSLAQEPNVVSTSGQHVQDVHQDYSNTQGAGDYTQLVNQYYELEEQRQKILQQLQQFGSWDYQGSSMQWEQPVSASQSSYPAVVASCCPYVGQCLVAPCTFGGTCVGRTCEASSGIGHNGNPPFEDGDIAKTAMGAAEKALSCLKTKASEKGEENHEEQAEGKAIRETDLTDVFNAWYSAGFYTGK
ncbi:hypothetical protein RHMOL_Rhmol11G0068300 [Rhododendron molle]|uniref:Uncharacterized protein n=1 Tax=Rhododendron molle TaxID=49168 RepID=A0ACC0LQF3_RHOML|nr:hypothetical protein RHMOL_Rhmol11G0068300 [Rhododendron molle]